MKPISNKKINTFSDRLFFVIRWLYVVLFFTVTGCATQETYSPANHPEHEIVKKTSANEIGYSLASYYDLHNRKKIQFLGGGILNVGIYEHTDGMTLIDGIEAAGGAIDCSDGQQYISVKRATKKFLYIINMPVSSPILPGDAIFINCFR